MARPKPRIGANCQYDLIIAIDLDCVNEQAAPAIQSFATEIIDDLIDEIFSQQEYVEIGFIRVGIIGFENSLHIPMPLIEMSLDNESFNKAFLAIKTLISIARNKANQESASFTQMFSLIPALFDARNNKSRQLILVTNAGPGLRHPGWSQYALADLAPMRQELYRGIEVTAIAVNAEPCNGGYGTWKIASSPKLL